MFDGLNEVKQAAYEYWSLQSLDKKQLSSTSVCKQRVSRKEVKTGAMMEKGEKTG